MFQLFSKLISLAPMRNLHNHTRKSILAFIDVFYPLFSKLMPLQTFRYAACGGANTLLDIFLYSVFYNYLFQKNVVHIGPFAVSAYIAAFLLSFVVTFPVGFYLSRYVVWQQTYTRKRVQLIKYFLVVAACIVLNYVFLKTFIERLGWYPTPAKVATSIIVVAFSYYSQRNFSFKAVTK